MCGCVVVRVRLTLLGESFGKGEKGEEREERDEEGGRVDVGIQKLPPLPSSLFGFDFAERGLGREKKITQRGLLSFPSLIRRTPGLAKEEVVETSVVAKVFQSFPSSRRRPSEALLFFFLSPPPAFLVLGSSSSSISTDSSSDRKELLDQAEVFRPSRSCSKPSPSSRKQRDGRVRFDCLPQTPCRALNLVEEVNSRLVSENLHWDVLSFSLSSLDALFCDASRRDLLSLLRSLPALALEFSAPKARMK